MTNRPAPSRSSRLRQREAMLSGIAKLVGCTALVVTVAVVFYVAVTQLDKEGPKVDLAYIDESNDPLAGYRWSGTEAERKDARLNLERPVLPAREARVQPVTLINTLPGPQTATQGGIVDLEAKRQQIEASVRHFFTATTIADKAANSREGARVQPLMEVYYKNHILSIGQWQGLGWVMPMDEPGHKLAYAQALFADSDPVAVIIEETLDGSIRVDWESSVRYGELEWKEFLATKPDQPTLFRVIASKPTASSDALTEAGQEVIELKHPAEQGTVYAYFNKDDPQFRSLLEQLKLGNWTNVPLTLRLCYPGPTSSARAVRIAGIEGKGWLILQNRRS